jgi:hypothetical protein
VVQILERAVAVVIVGPLVEGEAVEIGPEEQAVGLVLHVDADLLLHHVLLVGQVLRAEVERLHAVRLHPQDRRQRRRRRGGDVVGVVGAGGTVEHAAATLDHPLERALGRVGRALEHQVFKQVREAGAVLRLQPHADVVDHADADGG